MISFSFKTRPQKRAYSYNEIGANYSINTTADEITSGKCGVWNCYFQCEPYHMVVGTGGTETKYYQFYEKTAKNNYSAVSSTVFNIGEKYFYTTATTINGTNAVKHTNDIYYGKNGKYSYSIPSNASELPQTTYKNEDSATTYYFNTLIDGGDKYENGEITAMYRTPTNCTKETYGSLVNYNAKDVNSIYSFVSAVNSIPEYLTQNITDCENGTITSIKDNKNKD